jgi:hypothetical protein
MKLTYAKFHTTGDITLKGFFNPNTDSDTFMYIYTDVNGTKIAGMISLSHIVFIEYLDAE